MTHDDGDMIDRLMRGMSLPQDYKIIARHLHLMSRGEEPYRMFSHMTPWVRHICRAAANIIEECDRGENPDARS